MYVLFPFVTVTPVTSGRSSASRAARSAAAETSKGKAPVTGPPAPIWSVNVPATASRIVITWTTSGFGLRPSRVEPVRTLTASAVSPESSRLTVLLPLPPSIRSRPSIWESTPPGGAAKWLTATPR